MGTVLLIHVHKEREMERLWLSLACCFLATVPAGCGDLPTRVGDFCQTDQHCGSGEQSFTLTCDHNMPGGSCTVTECTPDDPDTLDVAEDETSCPAGSRCVLELARTSNKCLGASETHLVCRRSCEQQSDCAEAILCGKSCELVDDKEVCHEECKNRMMCVPFWGHLPDYENWPDPARKADAEKAAENPPRACVLYGKDCVHQEPVE
jgi:hypothetical protein